jgi:hypothetical protein
MTAALLLRVSGGLLVAGSAAAFAAMRLGLWETECEICRYFKQRSCAAQFVAWERCAESAKLKASVARPDGPSPYEACVPLMEALQACVRERQEEHSEMLWILEPGGRAKSSE